MKRIFVACAVASLGLAALVWVDDAQGARVVVQAAHVNAAHRDVRRVVYFHPVGHRVKVLPPDYRLITVAQDAYFYHDGHFYRHEKRGYVVVAPPLGARIRALPSGWLRFTVGDRRYYYVNATFYLWDEDSREYAVVKEPAGAADAMANAVYQNTTRLMVYPIEDQSDDQLGRDRYECHLRAVEKSSFDPTGITSRTGSRTDYDRAIGACLEGRGYSVS